MLKLQANNKLYLPKTNRLLRFEDKTFNKQYLISEYNRYLSYLFILIIMGNNKYSLISLIFFYQKNLFL